MFVAIGGHQFFEFLSLATGSEFLYRVGLVVSISATFFGLRAFEILTNRNIHSYIALPIIFLSAVYVFFIPVSFEGVSFYVRHNSIFVWSCLWMLLFFYWHVCVFSALKRLHSWRSREMLICYLFAIVDISFLLSVLYTVWGYSRYSTNVCTDSPSIWCTFFVLQAFILPFFLLKLPFLFRRPAKRSVQSWKKTIFFLFISVMILLFWIFLFPFFQCLSWKFLFP